MDLNPVVLAIPVFFGLMALEAAFEFITRKRTYRLNDAITNISTGTLQQLSGVFLKILSIGIYTAVFEYFSVLRLPVNGWTFAVLFVLYDLGYYWSHRMAHEVSLFWGGHVVHHQSEDFNLSVALRQSSTSILWSFPFYLPLAIAGFDPNQMLLVAGLNLLYQFWIHTEHIQKLPSWVEAVLNTPSHHRVHHGRDPKYIDKNYAGVFIVWDKMFGTFTEEEERPNYGITTPLNSWNPVYANFSHYVSLFKLLRQSKSLSDSFKILLNKPGWRPDYMGGYIAPQDVPHTYRKFDSNAPVSSARWYTFVQFMLASAGFSLFFFTQETYDPVTRIGFGSWIVVTTLMFGCLFEWQRAWLTAVEWIRLLTIPTGMYALHYTGIYFPAWAIALASCFVIGSLIWLTRILTSSRAVREF